MAMLRKIIFLLLVFFILSSSLYSANVNNDGVKFIIRNVNYTIEGKTRESVLRHCLDIKSGESFKSKDNLIAFLADKQQVINNERTLAEGNIDPSYIKDPGNPEVIFVDLEVFVRDTWNYILLPYARYDSNDGLLLSLRGRNYSFLGSMETMSLNLDFISSGDRGAEYSINGGLNLPFYLFGYNWEFYSDSDLTIFQKNPSEIDVEAGISVDIPLNRLTWQASIDQEYHLNNDGRTDEDGYYMKTAARFGSSIPTGMDIPFLGEVDYSPGITTSLAYKPFDSLSKDRKGYELGGEHKFSAGQINWYENFRNGVSFSAEQNLRYNFDLELWKSDQNMEFQFHKSFGWGGFSSRFQGTYYYNGIEEDIEEIGEPIRGILNHRLDGDAAFFLNLDFPVKIWIWFLDRWFEGHISPFFDYALVKPQHGDFSFNDAWYGAGIEGFAFLKAARSIYLRVSLGVDVEEILAGTSLGGSAKRDGAQIYALFIGLGHHY